MSTLKFEYRVLVSGPNGFEEKYAFQHEAPREAAVNRRPEANSFPSWSTRTWPRLTKSGPLGLGLTSSDPLVSITETHARVRAVREASPKAHSHSSLLPYSLLLPRFPSFPP